MVEPKDVEPNKEEQILQELRGLKTDVSSFRAEWKLETESNFFHYMVALTIAVWTLGAAFLLSGKYLWEGLALVFLGFVPWYAGILSRYRKHYGRESSKHPEVFRIQPTESGPPDTTNKQILDKVEKLHGDLTTMRAGLRNHYRSDDIRQYLVMLFTSGLAAMGVSAISQKDLVSNPGLFLLGFIALAVGSIGFYMWGLYGIWKSKMYRLFAVMVILGLAFLVYGLSTLL